MIIRLEADPAMDQDGGILIRGKGQSSMMLAFVCTTIRRNEPYSFDDAKNRSTMNCSKNFIKVIVMVRLS